MKRATPHARRPVTALKGVTFSAMAGMASMASSVLLLPIILASVGTEDYGTWLAVLSFSMLFLYMDIGLGTSVVHYLSRWRSGDDRFHANSVITNALMWAAGSVLVALPVYSLVVPWYLTRVIGQGAYQSSEVAPLLACGGAIVISMSLKPFSSALAGLGHFDLQRSTQIIGVFARVLMTLAVCWLAPNIALIALAETIGLLLPHVISAAHMFRIGHYRWSIRDVSLQTLRLQMSYSVGTFGVSFVRALLIQSAPLIVGFYGSATEITYYNAAYRVYAAVNQLITWLTEPFRPALSRHFVTHRGGSSGASLARWLTCAVVLATVLSCGTLIVGSNALLTLWLGDQVPVHQVNLVLTVLLTGVIFSSVVYSLVPVVDAAGYPGAFFLPQMGWLLGFWALSAVLGPKYGLVGISLGFVAPLPLVVWWCLLIVSRRVGVSAATWLSELGREMWVILVLFVVCYALMLSTRWLNDAAIPETLAFAAAFLIGGLGWLVYQRNSPTLLSVRAALRSPL
jgi:O-antigen/teichoic acid export membrane protein